MGMSDDLMASLERAQTAFATGDAVSIGGALTEAYDNAIALYGRLDPRRTSACARVQRVLETCIARIDTAQRHADSASLKAAVQLFAPVQPMLALVTE